MSFFDFDVVLPERRNRDGGGGGGQQAQHPSFDSLQQDDFAQTGAEEEDLAVYTWGEEGYDGLGDALLEEGDDFNDDTFGGEDDPPVAKDFDFHGRTARLDDRPKPPQAQPPPPSNNLSRPPPASQQRTDSRGRPAHSGSLEALWADSPSSTPPASGRAATFLEGTGDVWGVPAGRKTGAFDTQPLSSPSRAAGFSPFGDAPPPPPPRKGKTVDEIEAEMLAASSSSKPRPLTMEEIERDMMMRSVGQQQQQHLQQQQGYPSPMQMHRPPQQQQYQQPPHPSQQSPFPPHHQLQQQHQQYPPPLPSSGLIGHQQPILQQHQQQQQYQQHHQQQQQQSPFLVQPPPHLLQQQQLQQQPQQGSTPPPSISQQQQQPPLPQQQQKVQTGSGTATPTSSFNLAEMFPALPGQSTTKAAASTDLLGALAGLNEEEQAVVKGELERKIMEQEKADEKRKRKAWKIASMSQYNDIMTRSDKDFITRIQVSQLVTQDPYADDFYAQVYGAILRSKMGAPGGGGPTGPVSVLQLGRDGTGVGVGVPGTRGAGRRDFAMQRMTMQVKRIVDAAKQRERAKGDAGLEGALGKISLRSYKTAPRPMLQTGDLLASPAAPKAEPQQPRVSQQPNHGTPLTRRQALIALESLYELVLQLEQLRRNQPPPQAIEGSEEDQARVHAWQEAYEGKVGEVWKALMVNEPVEISFPHPFISLLAPTKGKRILPRLLRHLSPSQTLTIFTLLLACFTQLDVVWNAPPPIPPYTKDEERREKETDVFLGAVVPAFLAVLDRCELRMVGGMVGLVVERCDVVALAKTRPGVVLLTVLLSRAEVLKQETPEKPAPDAEQLQQWQQSFDNLFARLAPQLPALFPSSSIPPAFGPVPFVAKNPGGVDALDQPVWQMLGSFALHANMQQQQTLVGELRDKVLEGVVAAKQGWVDEETARRKIANVDLLLHALGLDSGMITA